MSLSESCVALAIMSATMMIAVPSLVRSREDYLLGATARQVASHLHSTRIKAVSRNRDCRMNVQSSTTYVIECEDPAWRTVEQIAMPRGMVISANARPEFHRRGNVSPMATITIRNDNGREKRVVVNITGRVRIQ
jgi:Tfp pilus assembly protein FimT